MTYLRRVPVLVRGVPDWIRALGGNEVGPTFLVVFVGIMVLMPIMGLALWGLDSI